MHWTYWKMLSLWPLPLLPVSLAYVVFPSAWNSTLFTLLIFWLHKPHPALWYLLDLHSIFYLNLNEHFKNRFLLQKKSEVGQSGIIPRPWRYIMSLFFLSISKISFLGTSLVVQWLRVHLAIQETQVWFLVQELRCHMLGSNWTRYCHN